MPRPVLLSWIGLYDLRQPKRHSDDAHAGPLAQAVQARSFAHIHLISDHPAENTQHYVDWLRQRTDNPIHIHRTTLTGPTQLGEIYEAAVAALNQVDQAPAPTPIQRVYHLSPGTPAMAAIWILLAKTSHPAELIESSPEQGVQTVSLPFDIAAEYRPLAPIDQHIARLTQGLPPEAPEFDAIVHDCPSMQRLVVRARRVARHHVPVLIQGESGTGKELLARAIHASSPVADGPFIAVNCGAIPPELVEAEFFGHTAGAFTGAHRARQGYLEAADQGTLFLDELGELPLDAQVKLLRALEEGAVRPLGADRPRPVRFRIIGATHRNLLNEIGQSRFREDLFHRLAVGVLQVPPLRQRPGDLNPIIDHLLAYINDDCATQMDWTHKKISAGARNLLHQHPWPGNIRELFNTLSRAAIWTVGDTIAEVDIQEALFPISAPSPNPDQILDRSLGTDLDLNALLAQVAGHYLKRALAQAKGNKTQAAALVGLPSYQTLTNWLNKYGVDAGTDLA
ncbi:MAG: AAA domain-containing protein [Candidatus Latescibacteria bacterium]|nr:AAA domain-containing protein [Candidatus Latescibacterota bacterium]